MDTGDEFGDGLDAFQDSQRLLRGVAELREREADQPSRLALGGATAQEQPEGPTLGVV